MPRVATTLSVEDEVLIEFIKDLKSQRLYSDLVVRMLEMYRSNIRGLRTLVDNDLAAIADDVQSDVDALFRDARESLAMMGVIASDAKMTLDDGIDDVIEQMNEAKETLGKNYPKTGSVQNLSLEETVANLAEQVALVVERVDGLVQSTNEGEVLEVKAVSLHEDGVVQDERDTFVEVVTTSVEKSLQDESEQTNNENSAETLLEEVSDASDILANFINQLQ